MALQKTQRNDVLALITNRRLDPKDFKWEANPLLKAGAEAILDHDLGEFRFHFDGGDWSIFYRPADGRPETAERVHAGWEDVLRNVAIWLDVIAREAGAPDMWAELRRERETLAKPSEAPPEEKYPFRPEELEGAVSRSSTPSRTTFGHSTI